MRYEIHRIWEILSKYSKKFGVLWIAAVIFSIVFYFISLPGYKADARILMENTRKPWADFKQGALPKRSKASESAQTLTLNDPFWNILYDQIEKTTYDFTPFFYSRTTVFQVIEDVGCHQHYDNGNMTEDEIVLAFTENLDVNFDRVGGMYDITFSSPDPVIARAVVDRYVELFSIFINRLSTEHNVDPTEAVKKNIARLQNEVLEIENKQAELKSESGIIAPAGYVMTVTNLLYMLEMRLVQAESRMKASRELLIDSGKRVEIMKKYGAGDADDFVYSISDIMADPMITILLTRIFWDSMNLAEAEMKYLEDTEQVKYWKDRLTTSKKVLAKWIATDEMGFAADLMATFTEESAKTLWLRQRKNETEKLLESMPGVETEYIYLQRKKVTKLAMIAQLRDLEHLGESYIQKGDKIAAVLDMAFLPKKKDEPSFLKILISSLFITTIVGLGWFFIRENIETHAP